MPEAEEEDLVTIHEVAVVLRVSDRTVYRWIVGGALEVVPVRCRGKYRAYYVNKIPKRTLAALLGEQPS